MWCVLDKDENELAFIKDEVEAECFKEVYYPEGRVEYRRINIQIVEDDE